MYRIGQKYKIETKKGIFYTAEIIEENDTELLIFTKFGEELVLGRSEIHKARLIKTRLMDGTEDGKDTKDIKS